MGIKRLTLASSAAVYGFHVDSIANEDFKTHPQSEYAQSKLDSEKEVLTLQKRGLCPVVLRQATVFGISPRMRFDLVVNTMTRDAFSRNKIFVYCAGDSWRPLVSALDVARAHIACIRAPEQKVKGQIFNVVQKNYRILELAHWIQQALQPKIRNKIEVEVQFGKVESRSYRISGDKIRKVIGYEAKQTVEDSACEILRALQEGKYGNLSDPIYYNIDWMKLLSEMESKLKVIGKVF
jgi:nucleoside-diphosphate-sugar epimerase